MSSRRRRNEPYARLGGLETLLKSFPRYVTTIQYDVQQPDTNVGEREAESEVSQGAGAYPDRTPALTGKGIYPAFNRV
jgi:hypothetical protein